MADFDWKQTLAKGRRPLLPRILLTPELLAEIGISPSEVVEDVFAKLTQGGCNTIGALLAIKTETDVMALVGEHQESGTLLWAFIQKQKALKEQTGLEYIQARDYRTVQDYMNAQLAEYEFPTSTDAYEFPNLELPAGNPYADSVRRVGVKQNLSETHPCPDFLLTRLEESIASVERLIWNPQEHRLACDRTSPRVSDADFAPGDRSINFIIGASGAGKTRFLYERCFKEFSALVSVGRGEGPPEELASATILLPYSSPEKEHEVEALRAKITQAMKRILICRALVLQAALKACPGLQPRHWLALQMCPERFVTHMTHPTHDGFVRDLFENLVSWSVSVRLAPELGAEWTDSKIRIVAIDQAQVFNYHCPNTFLGRSGVQKHSAILPLLDAMTGMNVHVLLASTVLDITDAYDGPLPDSNEVVRLLGVTTFFNKEALLEALRGYGIDYPPDADQEQLERFTGRPQLGMRLAQALLMQDSPDNVAHRIMRQCGNMFFSRMGKTSMQYWGTGKSVYSEIHSLARQWVLRGIEGKLSQFGDVALDVGAGALELDSSTNPDASLLPVNFVIKEPIIIEGLGNLSRSETFENGTLVSHVRLDEWVALNAEDLCRTIFHKYSLWTDHERTFLKYWRVARPHYGNMRTGIVCKDGEEPAAIESILENAGERGLSVVFPGPAMGADVVFAAKNPEDGCKLLAFFAQVRKPGQSAMRRLVRPYHVHDARLPYVPEALKDAHRQLQAIIRDKTNVSVAFLVFEEPRLGKRMGPANVHKHYMTVRDVQASIPSLRDVISAREARASNA